MAAEKSGRADHSPVPADYDQTNDLEWGKVLSGIN